MTREQAEAQRKQLAGEHPDATWMVSERESGDWIVVRVGLKPADSADGTSSEARPRPSHADDPRTIHDQTIGPWVGGTG